jgi:hypothetical protein
MKNKLTLLALASCVVISGCSTYATNRYSISADNVSTLRTVVTEKVAVGEFTATKPGESSIMCRGVGPIKTPDGEPFETFIRNALISEMKIAEVYAESAPVTITGSLDKIDFSSASGKWNLGLTLSSTNGGSFSLEDEYAFSTSFYGETACNQTGQALMPAVQNLITKALSSPDFPALVQ